MRHTTTAVLLAAVLALAGCSGSSGNPTIADPATCKTALADNYRKAMADGGKGPTASEPPSCVGLSTKTLEKITGEVISEYLDSDQAEEDLGKAFEDGMESAFATPSASGGVSPKCRTWIKAELLDGSEEIDATPGYEACGDLSDDELQAVVDSVEQELEAEITATP